MIFTFKKRAYQLGSKIIIMSIWTTKKNGNAAYACTRKYAICAADARIYMHVTDLVNSRMKGMLDVYDRSSAWLLSRF